jgi:hypothetical protein
MAHYAFLDENNIVVSVIAGKDETELLDGLDPETWYENFEGKTCLRTSYNTRGGVYYNPETNEPSENQSKAFRKNYAGIGYSYDEQRDAFIPPKLYNKWVLNEDTCLWESPTPYPEDGKEYIWNDNKGEWEEVIND